jgi:MYXO-CTERM domain-containing protein
MSNKEWMRRLTAAWLALGVLFCAAAAGAVGRVEWKSKTLKESEGHSWTVEVAIYLDRAPSVATLPMRFSFTPVVYYERSLLDGKEGPQLRNVPLVGKQPLVEGVDVGFMDPGTGKIEKRTKFSFKLKRGNGYEAGEYDVKIMDGRTDQTVGQQVRIVFQGENEVIDRRAMVFTGEKKKEKKSEGAGGGADAGASEQAQQTTSRPEDDPDYWKKGKSTSDDEQSEEVEPKRGCGCRVGADSGSEALGLVVGIGMLGGALARRRGKRAA